ncbi:hypothetical protein PVAND_013560 [Polypedilum vanderplanki]|uniref:Peptidase S1 domain-containing protein n=1 Tax=Polypedilum vanderplanki TaxID=319348 RepID=A0A9J6CQP5_POLVA|nr:hypothetical protein PVAND_013560 [Polypedilum vanderplanki]
MKNILIFLLFSIIFFKEAKSAPAIINGKSLNISEVPYQVALVDINSKIHFCGGAFLKLDFVITAAHCIGLDENGKEKKDFIISGGSNTYSDRLATELKVLDVFVHPQYNKDIVDFDFALVKFKNILNFPTIQHLVHLPPLIETQLPEGFLMLFSGWGKTLSIFEPRKFLRGVTIPIYNQQKCIDVYDFENVDITDRMICAGYKKGTSGLCFGDSGGPLVSYENKYLYGLASFVPSAECGTSKLPTVFARVSAARDWIVKIAGDDNKIIPNQIQAIHENQTETTTSKKIITEPELLTYPVSVTKFPQIETLYGDMKTQSIPSKKIQSNLFSVV